MRLAALTSGLTTKKFAGNPALTAFVRWLAVPCRLLATKNGFGAYTASRFTYVAFVKLDDVYLLGSDTLAPPSPEKYARYVGSGDVPAAPVYANVLPRPAAMFAWRLACAFLNSPRNPFSTMLNSL